MVRRHKTRRSGCTNIVVAPKQLTHGLYTIHKMYMTWNIFRGGLRGRVTVRRVKRELP